MKPFIRLALGLAAATMLGCAATNTSNADPAQAPHTLTNGDVELQVDVRIGRVTAYRRVGGANVLWINPRVGPADVYKNHGGDKIWPWPQRLWKQIQPSDWPPPAAWDGTPHRMIHASARRVVVASSPIDAWGVRVERTISLDASGTGVTFQNRLVKINDAPVPPLAVWAVAQIPNADWIEARLRDDAITEPLYSMLIGKRWTKQVSRDGRSVMIEREDTGSLKLGLDADRLAIQAGPDLFVIACQTKGQPTHEGAQVYCSPDLGYVELEFTGAMTQLKRAGDAAELIVRWWLEPTGGPDADKPAH